MFDCGVISSRLSAISVTSHASPVMHGGDKLDAVCNACMPFVIIRDPSVVISKHDARHPTKHLSPLLFRLIVCCPIHWLSQRRNVL